MLPYSGGGVAESGDEVLGGQGGHLWNLVALAHEVVETPVGVCEYCVHVSACRYMRHDSILTLTSSEGVILLPGCHGSCYHGDIVLE